MKNWTTQPLHAPKRPQNALRVGPDAIRVGPDALRVGPDALQVGPDALRVGPDALRVGPDATSGARIRQTASEAPQAPSELTRGVRVTIETRYAGTTRCEG